MGHLLTASGIVVLVVVLWQVFQDLFHPGGSAAISHWIGRGIFNLLRRRPQYLPLAGPLAVAALIAAWIFLLAVGFALIYYGSFPQDFQTSTGVTPPASHRAFSVFYFSFETLITLGYGDLTPSAPWMRVAANVEALVGFGLLTASVSLLVLIYPAIARTRLLARLVSNAVAAERRTGISPAGSGTDGLLSRFADDVTRTSIDLSHFPVIYFFTTRDSGALLASSIGALVRWSREGLGHDKPPPVRAAAAALDHALTHLADLLIDRFLSAPRGDREAAFRAFANDHLVPIPDTSYRE